MLFKRCRWLRQNILWFLCGVCTVIWIINFLSPFRNLNPHVISNSQGQRWEHGANEIQRESMQKLTELVDSIPPERFSVIKNWGGEWMNDDIVCRTNETFPQATLHTPVGDVAIVIYPPEDDVWVSGFLDREGGWERDLVGVIHNILVENPDWIFIDIGANIGVYTISIAKAGFQVVAIEPLASNIQRLCRSVTRARFNGTVHVIHNAVSSSRRKVSLGRIKGNVGGTYILDKTEEADTEHLEQTILLDDLAYALRNKSVIIKMDVEAHEGKVLRGATNFFKLVDVRYILMELQLSPNLVVSAKLVANFLQHQHMIPVLPTKLSTVLDRRNIEDWPSDVMWVKILH